MFQQVSIDTLGSNHTAQSRTGFDDMDFRTRSESLQIESGDQSRHSAADNPDSHLSISHHCKSKPKCTRQVTVGEPAFAGQDVAPPELHLPV
jgi:hypothetical protein